MSPPIKGSIIISLDTDSKFIATPDPGLLDRNIQWMQWSLVAPEGWKFLNPGITFLVPEPGQTFKAWPGHPIIPENDWQIRAFVNRRVNHGDPPEHYKYDFHIFHSLEGTRHGRVDFNIDPDMENQPQP